MRETFMRVAGYVLCVLGPTLAGVAQANSELDPPSGAAPPIVVQKLDPTTGVVTTYRVSTIDEKFRPARLATLPEAERNALAKEFIDGVAVPENRIAETKAERVKMPASELDPESSTAAWGWRYRWGWRGWGYRGGGYGWYGRGFYGYGSYYRPYWGYGGYYNGYYGYNGYGYNGYGYSGYGYSYYPSYTVYGCW